MRLLFLALALLGASAPSGRAAPSGESYSFGVTPQFEPRKLFTIWQPIINELKQRTGLQLELTTAPSVVEFERRLAAGAYDFVFTNPYHFMRLGQRQGYVPLVRDASPLSGVLVARKDSPVQSLADLNGKVLAIPSPNSAGASLMIQADLEHFYGVKMRLMVVKSHSSVFLHVAQGLADAGGGINKTLQQQPQTVREALRVIYKTREAPSHPISAHPRTPVDAREKVRAALIKMGSTADGAALLAKAPMPRPVAATLQDYLPMAGWGLEKYFVEGEN